MNREDIPLIKNILELSNNEVNTDLLYNILTVTQEFPDLADDILDSYSRNQFKSKKRILEMSNALDVLDKDCEVVIFGSWYGSILVPGLADKVKQITCIDLDEQILQISKNRLFENYSNIDYRAGDVFDMDLSRYHTTKLFINPSCEHMTPMKDFPYWPKFTHFVFTSNNMFDIEGHVNCVNSMDEFKEQLPRKSIVTFEDEITDERGIRFLLAGQISS